MNDDNADESSQGRLRYHKQFHSPYFKNTTYIIYWVAHKKRPRFSALKKDTCSKPRQSCFGN